MKYNSVQLIGYVGDSPKITVLKDGRKRAAIRVATHDFENSTYKNGKYSSVWHDVIAWGKKAEIAERSFVKGSRILVDGSIVYRTYPNTSGHLIYITDIEAHWLQNLDR